MSKSTEVPGRDDIKRGGCQRLAVPAGFLVGLVLLGALWVRSIGRPAGKQLVLLPSSKLLLDPPGAPQPTNSFPVTIAASPNGRYLALLNNGRGTAESGFQQSIAIVDLQTDQIIDNPDPRLKVNARQTYFLGLAFSSDGQRLFASVASRTDPTGDAPGNTGNGIAVYRMESGRTTPERFIRIPLQPIGRGKSPVAFIPRVHPDQAIPYPAGLAVIRRGKGDQILVADNLSDDALLLDATTGQTLQRYDLSTRSYVPASYPYTVVATRAGKRGYCSLWNTSQVAELDLQTGRVARWIPLAPRPGKDSSDPQPLAPTEAGSHPTAMLLSSDERRLYVTLSNADAVAVIDTASATVTATLSAMLPGQRYAGNYPNALAQSAKTLFVANASSNAVAVFDVGTETAQALLQARGFIPTEWYPTALAVQGEDLFIASGKGQGTGPNSGLILPSDPDSRNRSHPYIVSLLHGSLARVPIREVENHLAQMTDEVEQSNLMQPRPDGSSAAPTIFPEGRNPIRHVIYIIKENRTYDQVFGDLKPGNGDPSLVMFGEDVTPNQHALARNSASSTTSIAAARSPVTDIPGRWPPSPATTQKKRGRSATAARSTLTTTKVRSLTACLWRKACRM